MSEISVFNDKKGMPLVNGTPLCLCRSTAPPLCDACPLIEIEIDRPHYLVDRQSHSLGGFLVVEAFTAAEPHD